MPTQDISVSTTHDGNKVEASFELNVGSNLEELVEQLGEDIVYNYARQAYIIAAQSAARKLLPESQDEVNAEAVQDYMSSWHPGMKVARGTRAPVDPVAAILANWDNYPEEKRQELIRRLDEKIGGASTPAPSGRR